MRDRAGFSLIEVLIASVIMSFLVLAAMGTMRSSTGFSVLAGRENEATSRSMEKWESMRNEVHPDGHMDGMDGGDGVMLTEAGADRAWVITANPMGAPAGPPEMPSAMSQLMECTLDVDWIEPR